MSRSSSYTGAGPALAVAAAALRDAGTDPETVSIACALGKHGDCDGTLDAPRDPAGNMRPCRCPTPGAVHPSGH
jgi:hypothetical protein